MTWQYCHRCVAKGPFPGCRLCEQLNGRPMTEEEEAALLLGLQEAWERANPGWEKEVPYAG